MAGIENRRVAWLRQYGVREAGSNERVDRDTVFEACSMSKTPAAYLTLKLVEQDKLDLDRPLVEYLDEPYLSDEPLHKKITARMVLSHTTGFPNWRKGGWRGGGPLPVEFEPGSKFGYSGEGFLYLQRVIERVTATPFEEYVQRELLRPVGMTISSYTWQDRYETLAAAGHDKEGKVKRNRRGFQEANAGYSLYCTPYEYALYVVEILSRDRSADHSLNSGSIAAMLTPTTEATGRKPVERIGKTVSETVHWGLGWAINKTELGDRIYHTGTNGTGFRCYCEFDLRSGNGLVIMTNGLGGNELWEGVVAAIAP
jgi:CubicO group peptidase (beta-lactamase class C family)